MGVKLDREIGSEIKQGELGQMSDGTNSSKTESTVTRNAFLMEAKWMSSRHFFFCYLAISFVFFFFLLLLRCTRGHALGAWWR